MNPSTLAANSCTPSDNGTYLLFNDGAKTNYFIMTVLFTILEILALFLNICFIRIFYQDQEARKKKAKFLLILLAFSDVLTCIFILPVYILTMYMRSRGFLMCEYTIYLKCSGMASVGMSLVAVVAINIDLYEAIVKPYEYKPNGGLKKIAIIHTCVWCGIVVSAAVCMYILQIWKQFGIVACGITLILFVYIIYLHIKISKEISNMVKKEKRKSFEKSVQMLALSFRKSFNIAISIVVIFLLVYVPSIFMIIYRLAAKPSLFLNSYVLQWIQPFTLSNALWNPILYYFRMKSVRRKLFRSLCCFKRLHVDNNELNA